MNKETMENNKVELAGVIISEPEFMNHTERIFTKCLLE